MSKKRHTNIRNLNEIESINMIHGKRFGGSRKRLAAESGSKQLGCSWFELPVGRQSFPHHYHFGNEEAFFIISGTGEFRLGDEKYLVSEGDYIACPVGLESAHSITNVGTEPLRYLAFSTAHSTDVVVYPDSKKFAVAGGADMHKGLRSAPFAKVLKDQPSVDYYLDEE